MPNYEYHCESCNSSYELREGFEAASSHTCQSCEKGAARRVLHAPTVVFKGSGFYVNDSKRSPKKDSSSSSEKSTSQPNSDSSESKSGGKSAKSSGGKSSSKD